MPGFDEAERGTLFDSAGGSYLSGQETKHLKVGAVNSQVYIIPPTSGRNSSAIQDRSAGCRRAVFYYWQCKSTREARALFHQTAGNHLMLSFQRNHDASGGKLMAQSALRPFSKLDSSCFRNYG
jgi:hypothetical protein